MRIERPVFPWGKYNKQLLREYPSHAGLSHTLIDISEQKMYVLRHRHLLGAYSISSSRFGTGYIWGSYRTPLGAHYVAEKIGAGEPLWRQFIRRQPGKKILDSGTASALNGADAITTRILRLAGLEMHINTGGYVDSLRRCIYIHGTVHEDRIGKPASFGCIRMRNEDVREVFDVLQVNSLVYILQ